MNQPDQPAKTIFCRFLLNKPFIIPVIMLLTLIPSRAEVQRTFTTEEQGAWGFIDRSGSFQIGRKFNSQGEFKNGFATVCYGKDPDNYEAIIDKQGHPVGGMIFSKAGKMYEGLAAVAGPVRRVSAATACSSPVNQTPTGQTYISKTGSLFTKNFKECGDFSSGTAIVQPNGRESYALIDRLGQVNKTLIGVPLSLKFEENLIPILVENSLCYANLKGSIVLKTKFRFGSGFHEGLAAVANEESDGFRKWGYLNQAGKLVVPCIFQQAGDFHEGLAKVHSNSSGVYGFIDRTGKLIIKLGRTDSYGDFCEGLTTLENPRGSKILDCKGRIILDLPNCTAGSFHEGLCRVSDKSGKWGYINKAGAWVIPAQFSKADDFSEGLAAVCIRDEAKINRERVLHPQDSKNNFGNKDKLF